MLLPEIEKFSPVKEITPSLAVKPLPLVFPFVQFPFTVKLPDEVTLAPEEISRFKSVRLAPELTERACAELPAKTRLFPSVAVTEEPDSAVKSPSRLRFPPRLTTAPAFARTFPPTDDTAPKVSWPELPTETSEATVVSPPKVREPPPSSRLTLPPTVAPPPKVSEPVPLTVTSPPTEIAAELCAIPETRRFA